MKKVNIEMLARAISSSTLPVPSEPSERLSLNVLDKVSYLNLTSITTAERSSDTVDPPTIEYTEVTLIAIPYAVDNKRWLEWELLL